METLYPIQLRTHPTNAGVLNEHGRLLINFIPRVGIRFDVWFFNEHNEWECSNTKITAVNEDERELIIIDVEGTLIDFAYMEILS